MERELESLPDSLSMSNLVFDDSGNFLMYPSLPGIKILNLVTNKVVRTLGTHESSERFLSIALYQGVPKIDAQFMLARAGGVSGTGKTVEELNSSQLIPDPTIYCTSFKRRRFYCFSKRNPDESEKSRYKIINIYTYNLFCKYVYIYLLIGMY
jgi:peptidylprolyl isomerase domain and WD repeat-containing protein 1